MGYQLRLDTPTLLKMYIAYSLDGFITQAPNVHFLCSSYCKMGDMLVSPTQIHTANREWVGLDRVRTSGVSRVPAVSECLSGFGRSDGGLILDLGTER